MENKIQNPFCIFCVDKCINKWDGVGSIVVCIALPWVAALILANKYINFKK